MKIGTKIFAPQGWASLPMGVEVHFLKNDSKNKRILFVHFAVKNKGPATATLMTMSKFEFEEGVTENKIQPCSEQPTLPPWLSELEGVDLSQIDSFRTQDAKMSHHDRVNDRYQLIASAVNDFEVIMDAQDPQKEINRRARLCSPPQNESRFRLWLLTYLCFGRNIWVLLPPFHKSGHWDRMQHPDTKFGAPSKAFGHSYGYGKVLISQKNVSKAS